MSCAHCHFFRPLKHPETSFGMHVDGVCFVHARASGKAPIVNQDDGKTCKLYTDASVEHAINAIHKYIREGEAA